MEKTSYTYCQQRCIYHVDKQGCQDAVPVLIKPDFGSPPDALVEKFRRGIQRMGADNRCTGCHKPCGSGPFCFDPLHQENIIPAGTGSHRFAVKLKIVLPFPLPTWNRLLAMNRWERKRCRDWIHRAVSICIAEDTDSLTSTTSPRKQLLMLSCAAEYLPMIRPKSSKKSRKRKKKSQPKNLNPR